MENENMSEIIKNLTHMLGEDNIPENLKETLQNLNTNANTTTPSDENTKTSSISPDMLANLVNLLQSSHSDNTDSSSSNTTSTSSVDMEMLMKMKTMIEKMNANKNDPRSNLLLSLKPYLNQNRQSKVEQYVKLLNMSKIMDIWNANGGDAHHG